MKFINLLFVSLLVFLFFSCNKADNVTGTITNFYTGQPVIGAPVWVERYFEGGEEGSINYIGRSATDETGRFKLSIDGKRLRNHYFVSCKPYAEMTEDPFQEAYFYSFPINVGTYTKELDNSKKQNAQFTLIPTCRMKFNVSTTTVKDLENIEVTAFNSDFERNIFADLSSIDILKDHRIFLPCNGTLFLAIHAQYKHRPVIRTDTIFIKQFEKMDYEIKF